MRGRGAILGLVLLISGCASDPGAWGPVERVAQARGALRVGCARASITPSAPVWLGGFGLMRESLGVHDPLYARALALEVGDARVVLVACDLIGLHFSTVQAIRERLGDVLPAGALLVTSTHTHSGPDTLGLWGLPPLVSGVDDATLEQVQAGVEAAARRALLGLEPARVRWGQAQAPVEGVSYNRRDPESVDRTLTCLAFDRLDGSPLATLVHYACHPEALGSDNDWVSADFAAALVAGVEARRPGVALYVNGALGAMVTTAEAESTFSEAARIGRALSEVAAEALAAASEPASDLQLVVARAPLEVAVDNWRYGLADWGGLLPGREFSGGRTASEVWGLRLGDWVTLSVPGEASPRLGFELEAQSPAQPFTLAGLGNDELGYLLHEAQWDDPRYRYERTVSPGLATTALVRDAGGAVLEALSPDAAVAPTRAPE
ncbi:MAG: neutral/alkaline non-lysosomal ceramidase N-terminal domain-containing protein [Planctomycetota bacterium]